MVVVVDKYVRNENEKTTAVISPEDEEAAGTGVGMKEGEEVVVGVAAWRLHSRSRWIGSLGGSFDGTCSTVARRYGS